MNSFPLCRFCRAPLRATFVDLGSTPLANSYLAPDELGAPEPTFPLHARLCSACRLVQVDDVAAPEKIFGHYAYFSSYSASWVEHARRFAVMAKERWGLGAKSLVVEVASNDGYLLRHFVDMDVPVLGIEPAANVAEAARAAVSKPMSPFSAVRPRNGYAAKGRSRSYRRKQRLRPRSRYQ